MNFRTAVTICVFGPSEQKNKKMSPLKKSVEHTSCITFLCRYCSPFVGGDTVAENAAYREEGMRKSWPNLASLPRDRCRQPVARFTPLPRIQALCTRAHDEGEPKCTNIAVWGSCARPSESTVYPTPEVMRGQANQVIDNFPLTTRRWSGSRRMQPRQGYTRAIFVHSSKCKSNDVVPRGNC